MTRFPKMPSEVQYISTPMPLHLYTEGQFVKLRIQCKGVWVDLITERLDSPFSHFIEPSGIEKEIEAAFKSNQP